MSREVLAEALFASPLSASGDTDVSEALTVIVGSLERLGVAGCVAVVAEEFGDHPETAVPRMRWALGVVDSARFPAGWLNHQLDRSAPTAVAAGGPKLARTRHRTIPAPRRATRPDAWCDTNRQVG